MIQVLPELEPLDVMLPKIPILKKIHSMAMVYKAVSVNVNVNDNKLMNLRYKSKLQYTNIDKNNKMVMPFDDNNKMQMHFDKSNNE